MFKAIFENVTFDTFQIEVDKELQTISFKSSPAKEGTFYLTLSINNKPAFSAKALSKVNDCLIRGEHRKDFYIIHAYDEPSAYYCEKLAPRFGKVERLMRSFIYTTLTKSLGIEWFESSFSKEIQSAIRDKGLSYSDLIERGLYEMTFAQLYDYLFAEFSYCSAEIVVYEQLLTQNLEEMDKETIISAIKSCQKECLWNRFFSDADFNLEEPLRKMRDYRNKVAHNKFIKYSEYTECIRGLTKINTTLQNAIHQLHSDIYTEKHLTDTVMSFVALFAGLLKNNYDVVSVMQKNFNALSKTLIKAFEIYASPSKMANMYKLGAVLSDLQRISSSAKEHTADPL